MIDSLSEIKNAEEKAASIIVNAKDELERMVNEANKKREEIYSVTKKQAVSEINKIKNIHSDQGNEESKKILIEGEKELEFLTKNAKDYFSKGVEAALSRVIK